ncbi:hypothetical protein OC503_02630 [Vibrio vulnificus]|nr:hypothetical protein [Vibrio vulnificus]MCU8366166.1 hypothetical protein [Vibrio vulnificus]
MDTKEDVYIRTIEYAVEKDGSFNLTKMLEDLALNEQQIEMIRHQVASGGLLAHEYTYSHVVESVNIQREVKVWCSALDRFRLLEYQELRDARESSRSANTKAIFAIIVSIVSFMASIFISLYQMSTPISLPSSHFEHQKEIINKLSVNLEPIERSRED